MHSIPAAMEVSRLGMFHSQHPLELHTLATCSHRSQALTVRQRRRRSNAAKGTVCSATLQRQSLSTGSHLPAASWRTDFSARFTLGAHIGSGR